PSLLRHLCASSFSMPPPPPRSTLFPYTTLFRSGLARLEQFIHDLSGSSAVIVSHDREFLDRTVTRVVELDEWTRGARDYAGGWSDRKSTRLNSSHVAISYAVFCLKKKKTPTLNY